MDKSTKMGRKLFTSSVAYCAEQLRRWQKPLRIVGNECGNEIKSQRALAIL